MPERIDSRCGICHTAERLDFQRIFAHRRGLRTRSTHHKPATRAM
jgi:hypothetical protein